MFSNVSLPLLIFLIIFSMIHFANASLEHAVELTEASKATGKSKKSLKVGKKTTYAPHPQNQLENLNLEMAQQLINEHHKNADPNELIREEKQSTELRSRNTFKVSEPHPISQQTPPVQQFNPSGDPYLSYLHHNHGGYQPPYLGAYASHYPSYGPPTAVPGSLLAQTTLTPDVNYVGPVVIPTVYDLFEYGYRQNYMPFAQTIPSTGHSVPGLENFGQSKGTGVYHDHFVRGGLPYMPSDHWEPSNEAESQLLYQQIPSEKVVPRISKPLVKEKNEPSSNKQVSESRKEIDSELEKEKSNRSLQVENNLYDNTYSKEKKKIDYMDENLNKRPEPKGIKTISTSKDKESMTQSVNQSNNFDSHSAPVDDSGQNIKGDSNKIDSGLDDENFYNDYPIQIGSIKIPTSRWRPRNAAESLSHVAQPAPSKKMDSSKNNLMDRILNPSEKEINKFLSENQVVESSKKTNIDKDQEKSSQTSPAPKKLINNTHEKKNKNIDEVDDMLNELPENRGLKKTLISEENESANQSVNQFNTHDLHSDPFSYSGQNLKGENNKINPGLKDKSFYGDYPTPRGVLENPISHWRPQNKAESGFHDAQTAQPNKFDSSEEKSKKKFVEARPKRLKSPKESTKTKVGQRSSKKKLDTNNSEIVLKLDNDRAKQSDNEKGKSSSTVKVNSKNKLNHENLVQAEFVLKKNTKSGKESFELSTESSSVSKKSAKSHYLGKNNERASKINLSEEYRHTYDKAMLYKEALFLLSEKDAMKLVLEDFPGIINHLIIVLIQAIAVVEKVTDKGLIQEIFNGIEGGASADPHNLNIAIKWIRNTISDSKELVEKEQCFNKMFFNWLVHKKNQETNGNNLIEKIHEVVKSHPLYYGN
ncbi:hypothetical protein PPACK8108_LOCUS6364 [Phakopsora pachyrhizi]|uniref:Uncharacterized protein n=1 Tax=Phakopsora pachyrhizi TaxID=170000 RepID=A0AAV0ATM8_PHAPC|nr:hypothetical protein PPACK8108_LOCUS6364 [Phakopsora pachyrhizi]